jgi:hypothetical protein
MENYVRQSPENQPRLRPPVSTNSLSLTNTKASNFGAANRCNFSDSIAMLK